MSQRNAAYTGSLSLARPHRFFPSSTRHLTNVLALARGWSSPCSRLAFGQALRVAPVPASRPLPAAARVGAMEVSGRGTSVSRASRGFASAFGPNRTGNKTKKKAGQKPAFQIMLPPAIHFTFGPKNTIKRVPMISGRKYPKTAPASSHQLKPCFANAIHTIQPMQGRPKNTG